MCGDAGKRNERAGEHGPVSIAGFRQIGYTSKGRKKMAIELIPEDIQHIYEIHEWKHATAILRDSP